MLKVRNHSKAGLLKTMFSASILLCSTVAMAQSQKSGVIKDANGEPLIGVTVLEQGTSNGTVTDVNGRYTLKTTKPNAKLKVSYIGYESQVITPGQSVTLSANDATLNEVVVVGYGTMRRKDVTSSITTVNAKDLDKGVYTDPAQMLQGKVAGLVISSSGDPNGSSSITLRGSSSLREGEAMQPYYVIDGIPGMDISMVAPDDIESIDVLRDATATAIYGSKAANGVVVIETKAPTKGKLQISYKGDYSLDFADLSDYNLMNSREKLEFEKLAGVYKDNTSDPFNQIKLDNLYNSRLRDIEQGVDTYWLSVPLRTGFTHKHNVYAEGGEGNVRYGLGLNYGMVNGVMKGSDRETLGGNLDLIYRTGKFQFSNKLSIDYLETNNPAVSFAEYAQANPYYKKYGANGKINKYLYYPEDGLNDNPVSNPLWNAHLNNYDKGQRFGFTNNFIAEWFATDDLRVRAKFGMTKYDDTQDERLSPEHTDFDDKEATQKGLFKHSLQKYLYYEGDISATFGKLIAKKHQINAVLGFNFNNTTSKTNGYSATGFTDDQFAAPSFANNYPTGGKPRYSENIKHASSFYLNGGYAYDNRYLLDFNLRNDGASMFGTDNRFRTTWSVGLGWNIHHEKWLEDRDIFQLLKLRASVGNPGNQNFSAYQAYTTYIFNSLMSNIFGTGVIINSLGNNDLAWQETINYNFGADVTTLGNRLNLTLDYFIKNTDPLLAIITTPGSMGVTSEALNAGKQKTNGWEATIKFSPIYMPQQRINWNISLSATHAKSKYANIGNAFSALNESGKTSLHNTTRYYDGGSPTAIWAVRSAGIDPATGKELFIKRDGTYSFTYDASDEVVCGDTEPDVEGLLGTTFYYKGFSFSCYFRYQYGGQLFNSSLFDKVENIGTADVYNNQDRRALYDRWSVNNRNALYKGISMVQKTDKSSRFVMDENTLTCESINIGYEFPLNIAKKFGMQALSIQANMNDIFRCSTVKAERGIDYPFARTVSFSIGATF